MQHFFLQCRNVNNVCFFISFLQAAVLTNLCNRYEHNISHFFEAISSIMLISNVQQEEISKLYPLEMCTLLFSKSGSEAVFCQPFSFFGVLIGKRCLYEAAASFLRPLSFEAGLPGVAGQQIFFLPLEKERLMSELLTDIRVLSKIGRPCQ